MKYICLLLLRFYKRFISPYTGNGCIYTPTCSMYMYDAVVKHGALKGVGMGLKRLMRCTPFHRGGFDPVPENYRGKIKWLI
ncbi:MAG: membrane protein insertion efficiency factor YidD [Clostridiales bacterium]|nr:membrane protein insertion efficiency factor YidD [Clostridiales bacterium]